MFRSPAAFLLAASVLAAGLAVVHDDRLPRFAWTWRTVAGGMALLALFAAAIPDIGGDGVRWSPWLVAHPSFGA